MNPKDCVLGDRVRVMDPTKLPNGFVDCSTVLTVHQIERHPRRPNKAYWTALDGRKIVVPLIGEVDKVT